MECLCGHHEADCPIHSHFAIEAAIDDQTMMADEWAGWNEWQDTGGEG